MKGTPRERREVEWGSGSPALRAVAAAGLLLAGCGEPAPPPRPLVLLISLDTFRWDSLGAARGLSPSPTPRLDALARDGALFAPAIAPMPFTLPSHMTMLTGAYPAVHGVSREGEVLPPTVVPLAELLRDAGYRCFGFVTSDWLHPDFGFSRGFERYEKLRVGLTHADRVTDSALAVLDSLPAGPPPTFLFLHYFDPHSDFGLAGNRLPYYSPPGFRPRPRVQPRRFCSEDGLCATAFLLASNDGVVRVARPLVRAIRGLYDAGVRHTDAALGRLFDGLARRGLYDDALIVLTSDHGEEFREHGLFIHSQTYEETVAVPLIVKVPAKRHAGRVIEGPVALMDILPTLLDYLGLEAPAQVQGTSLLPAMRGEPAPDRPILSQDKLRRLRFALRTREYKLIIDRSSRRGELYDLRRDPGETRDASADRPETVALLRQHLTDLLVGSERLGRRLGAQAALPGQPLFTEEERRRLRALGYVD